MFGSIFFIADSDTTISVYITASKLLFQFSMLCLSNPMHILVTRNFLNHSLFMLCPCSKTSLVAPFYLLHQVWFLCPVIKVHDFYLAKLILHYLLTSSLISSQSRLLTNLFKEFDQDLSSIWKPSTLPLNPKLFFKYQLKSSPPRRLCSPIPLLSIHLFSDLQEQLYSVVQFST